MEITRVPDIALVVAGLPAHYQRDILWSIDGTNHSIVSPNALTVNVNNSGYRLPLQITLDLTQGAAWDSQTPDYTVAVNRAGKNFYIYA